MYLPFRSVPPPLFFHSHFTIMNLPASLRKQLINTNALGDEISRLQSQIKELESNVENYEDYSTYEVMQLFQQQIDALQLLETYVHTGE